MKETADCTACKAISVTCFLGIGSYLMYIGKSQTPLSKYSMYMLGLGAVGLGIGELFDKSPFRHNQ